MRDADVLRFIAQRPKRRDKIGARRGAVVIILPVVRVEPMKEAPSPPKRGRRRRPF